MKKYLLSLLCSSVITIAMGQEREFKNEFGFKSDNDSYLFYGQDRYYTNGLFIYFRQATDQQKNSPAIEKKVFEISVGQKMFNPYSGQAPDPALHDRPFAGYLYGGFAYSWFFKNESVLKGEFQIGTIGPSSLAEDGQELLHNLVGFYEVEGWDYQIRNAIGLNASVQYTRLLHRASNQHTDFSFDGNASVGTTFNSAGAGILFRAGKINQLFNSAITNSVVINKSSTKKRLNSEFFFYAKPQLNLIAYDATVQGGITDNNSPVTFDVKPVVFSQLLGINYSTSRFTIDYSVIFKTKEIKSTAKGHQYGSISMYYRFN
ncbi:MAG: lipid A deacylase LpxR family protein [Pedobacter sp.]|nr:MAG: lipid A deacylase LpxR family protein [Pedobacter sp.]